jgi:hypothetical protein
VHYRISLSSREELNNQKRPLWGRALEKCSCGPGNTECYEKILKRDLPFYKELFRMNALSKPLSEDVQSQIQNLMAWVSKETAIHQAIPEADSLGVDKLFQRLLQPIRRFYRPWRKMQMFSS